MNFEAGHIAGNGKLDTETQAFELTASGDRIQLDHLEAYLGRPNLPKLEGTAVVTNLKASGILNLDTRDFSSYQIEFNAVSQNATLDGRPAGAVSVVGRTENKQLNVTLTSTGLLGDQPQVVTARVDLSNASKLPGPPNCAIPGLPSVNTSGAVPDAKPTVILSSSVL